MPSSKVIVTGIREIDRKLEQLPLKVQKKVIRQSMRDGMKVMTTAAKAAVPVDTGLTRDSIQTRALKTKKGRSGIETRTAPAKGKFAGLVKGKGDRRAYYPAIVEYGSKGHAPNPWMRRTFAAKGEAVRLITIQAIRRGVEREASRK